MKNITLNLLLKLAMKNIVPIILGALVAASATVCYIRFLTEPSYYATGSILVTNNGTILLDEDTASKSQDKLENADLVTSLNFASTVVDILQTNGIYKQLSAEIGNRYTYGQLKSMATVARRNENTLFIDIRFTSNDPDVSRNLVNSYLELAPDYICGYVPNTASSVTPADGASSVYISILAAAFFAAIVGAAAVYVVVFLIYSSDTLIRDTEGFRNHFDIPVIGVVPDFASARDKDAKYYKYGRYGSRYGGYYSYYGKTYGRKDDR